MGYTFVSATILLLLITDPIGNIPIFINSLRNVPAHRRVRIILREVFIAFCLLLAFMFIGKQFLDLVNLSDLSMQIAGAVVLFLIAIRMIFPSAQTSEVIMHENQEPLIVPLAIPALAGPSALATVMLLVSQAPDRRMEWVMALLVTMLVCAIVLVLADRIQRLLGDRVVMAIERLMGLILVAMSVEMLLRGIKTFAAQLG